MKETLNKLWQTRKKVNRYLSIAKHWKDKTLQEVYFDRLRTIDLKIEIEINKENHLPGFITYKFHGSEWQPKEATNLKPTKKNINHDSKKNKGHFFKKMDN